MQHLGGVVAAAAHEMGTPLATIKLVAGELVDDLAGHGVFVLPGALFEAPGFFRISLTANDEMVERSLPGFAAAIESALARPGAGR